MKGLLRRDYNKKIGIYRIYSLKNNKSYIGSSSNLYSRINKHINDLKNNKKTNIKLQNHYNKYGENDLKLEIICLCNLEELLELELQYILKYNSFRNGFNCLGISEGFQGYKFTKEQCENLKNIQKLNAIKYRTILLENLKKARLSKINNPIKIDWWIGKKHLEKSKLKMSESAKKRKPSFEIPVIQVDMKNNFIAEYKSSAEAERQTGVYKTNIGKCCLNKRKSAGKFKWHFKV